MDYLVEGLTDVGAIEAFMPPPDEWDPGGGGCRTLCSWVICHVVECRIFG